MKHFMASLKHDLTNMEWYTLKVIHFIININNMAYNPTINEIKDITPLLSNRLQFDYTNFGLSFLKRRFAYISEVLNIKKHQNLIDGINNGYLLEDIKYYLPVKSTELFRDPSFWRFISAKIEKFNSNDEITFWFPELCSTEELYSLLIIISQYKPNQRYKVISPPPPPPTSPPLHLL